MKYLAILRDSFREALDSKVLYVMLVLSTLVTILVAGFSFKPQSAHITMEQFFPSQELQGLSIMYLALYNQELREASESPADVKKENLDEDGILGRFTLLHAYRLEKVDVIDGGEPDSPNSDYLVTIADAFPAFRKDVLEQEKVNKNIARVRKIFERADEFGLLRIGDITLDPDHGPKADNAGGRYRYRVPIYSTPQTFRLWANKTKYLAWELPTPAAPLGYQIYVLSRLVILFGAWICINVGVIVTSFFIPNMLSKGTIDMLLVKPVHRWTLILYKYIGGLTFIFINGLYAMLCLWLVIGLRTGVWPTGCLLLILTITFFFAILYAISTYVSVVTRSAIASIMLTLVAWLVFFGVGWGHDKINGISLKEKTLEKIGKEIAPDERWGDGRLATTVNFFYAITPRTEDLNQLNDHLVYCNLITGDTSNMAKLKISEPNWPESVGVASLWIGVFLGMACAWFSFKDY